MRMVSTAQPAQATPNAAGPGSRGLRAVAEGPSSQAEVDWFAPSFFVLFTGLSLEEPLSCA